MEMSKTKTEAPSFADRAAIVVATAGGAGFVPKAPGTAGSAVGVALYLVIQALGAGAYYPHVIIFVFIVGTWAANRTERMYGHDSQRIVIDEVIGQMVTFGFADGRYRFPTLFV